MNHVMNGDDSARPFWPQPVGEKVGFMNQIRPDMSKHHIADQYAQRSACAMKMFCLRCPESVDQALWNFGKVLVHRHGRHNRYLSTWPIGNPRRYFAKIARHAAIFLCTENLRVIGNFHQSMPRRADTSSMCTHNSIILILKA